MIPRYTDHAANERTFLAWVRTALAIVAFGCVLAKFDLFLRLVAHVPPGSLPRHGAHGFASLLGVFLTAAGTCLLPASLWHYLVVRRDILAEDSRHTVSERLCIVLTAILAVAGLCACIMLLAT